MAAEFVDTNLIVYAHDRTAGEKQTAAAGLLLRLAESGEGCISVQVLQELFVALTRKIPIPLDPAAAREVVEDLAAWRVFAPGPAAVLAAIDLQARYRLSFWDAMIVQAATALEVSVLWSEDLAHGREYGGVTVRSPFRRDESA